MSNIATIETTAVAKPIARATKEDVATEVSKILVLLGALDRAFEPQTKQQQDDGTPARYTLEVRTAINYLSNHFKNLKVGELLLAFELAMEGKFECELTHYGNLNAAYFANVIRAYLKYKSAQQVSTAPVEKAYTEAEKAEMAAKLHQLSIEYLLETFDRYKTNKGVLISHTFCKLLNQLGISLWPADFTDEKRQLSWLRLISDCHEQRKVELSNQLQIAPYNKRLDIKRKLDSLEPQNAHFAAQRQLLRVFFDRLIKQGIELKDLITETTTTPCNK